MMGFHVSWAQAQLKPGDIWSKKVMLWRYLYDQKATAYCFTPSLGLGTEPF